MSNKLFRFAFFGSGGRHSIHWTTGALNLSLQFYHFLAFSSLFKIFSLPPCFRSCINLLNLLMSIFITLCNFTGSEGKLYLSSFILNSFAALTNQSSNLGHTTINSLPFLSANTLTSWFENSFFSLNF